MESKAGCFFSWPDFPAIAKCEFTGGIGICFEKKVHEMGIDLGKV